MQQRQRMGSPQEGLFWICGVGIVCAVSVLCLYYNVPDNFAGLYALGSFIIYAFAVALVAALAEFITNRLRTQQEGAELAQRGGRRVAPEVVVPEVVAHGEPVQGVAQEEEVREVPQKSYGQPVLLNDGLLNQGMSNRSQPVLRGGRNKHRKEYRREQNGG